MAKGVRWFNLVIFIFGCLLGFDGFASLTSAETVFQQLIGTVSLAGGALLIASCLLIEVAVRLLESNHESNSHLDECRDLLDTLVDCQRIANQLAERQAAALERLKRNPQNPT